MDNPQTAIVTPAPDATSFTVDGVTYTATDGLSVARLRIFDRLALEFGADITLRGLATDLDAIYAALNKADFVEAAGLVRDRRAALNISGANRIKEVELCGLFLNAPDEDAAAYDFAAMQAKCYTAWGAVAGGFFTVLAMRLLPTSRGSYGRYLDEVAGALPPLTAAP